MSGVGTVALARARSLGRRRRTTVGIGLAGVLLTFAVLATLQAFTIHPFHPPDEMSHVGYALDISHGDLPTIETPIPGADVPLLAHRVANSRPANRTIWTANHPPLYYLVAAVPLRIGVALDRPLGGVRAARLVTIGISLAGLALVVLLARELVPGRPELWVGRRRAGRAAAGAGAHLRGGLQRRAGLHADRRRPGAGHPAAAVGADAAAAGAARGARGRGRADPGQRAGRGRGGRGRHGGRAVWRHADRPGRTRACGRPAPAAAVALAAVAAAGWFYVRNRSLYGSATGTGALLAKFARGSHGSVPQTLLAPEFWHDQLRRLWDDSAGPSGRNGFTKWWYLIFVPVLGLALAGVRWLRRAVPPPAALALGWLACLGVAGLVELSAASFYSLGGTAHGRYLLPALSVLAVAAAAGLAALPGRRGAAADRSRCRCWRWSTCWSGPATWA